MSPRFPGSSPLALVVALVTLTAGLAGCIGSEPDPAVGSTSTGVTPTDGGTAVFEGSPDETTLWRNGSFTAQDHVDDAGEGFVGVASHRVPLAEQIPQGSPVRLEAELTYEAPLESASSGQTNTVALLLEPGDGVAVVDQENDDEAGRERLTATVVRFEDGNVDLQVQNLVKPEREYEYTLEVRVSLDPATVPAGLPTAVDVPADAAAIEVAPAAADAPLSATAWGPDDGYLGWRSSQGQAAARYPVDEAGTHVVRVNASAHLRLVDEAGQPVAPESPLEPLQVETRLGEGHALPAGMGPETWTTDVSRAPVGVSFQVLPTGPADSGLLAGQDIRVQISTQNGSVMDEPFLLPANPFAAGAPPLGDGLTGFPRTFAHPNATEGEWTWTARYDLAAEVEIVPLWIHYERGR